MTARFPCVAALLVSLSATSPAERAYTVFAVSPSPVLDGKMSGDAAWDAIPGVTGFCMLGGDYAIAKQTTVKAAWDKDALYVAMECEEPDAKELRGMGKDGHDLWLEDSVEIFLSPAGAAEVFQFIANTAGARTGAEAARAVQGWEAQALKGDDFWSVELKLPFKALGHAPASGTPWHAAFCRNTFIYTSGGSKFTSWPALQARYLEPQNFTTLTFVPRSLSPSEARQSEATLNGPYRDHLARTLADLVKAGEVYRTELSKALQMDSLRGEGARLQNAWDHARQVSARSSTAPFPDLRFAIRRASALRADCYQFKYAVLFKELFDEK